MTIPPPGHAAQVKLKTLVTTSDSKGKFSVGPWISMPLGIFIIMRHINIKAEKNGYEPPPIGYLNRGKRVYISIY